MELLQACRYQSSGQLRLQLFSTWAFLGLQKLARALISLRRSEAIVELLYLALQQLFNVLTGDCLFQADISVVLLQGTFKLLPGSFLLPNRLYLAGLHFIDA